MFLLSAIDKQNVLHALELTWKGMLAIFLVMGLIFLAIVALNFFTNKQKVAAAHAKLKARFFKKKTPTAAPAEEPTQKDESSQS